MDWLDTKSVGYMAWTWTYWSGSCWSLISDYSGTATTYGAGFYNHLNALGL